MIIFLYGPDDYRRTQKKRSVIAEFKKKRSELGLETFDLEKKEELERLSAFLRNQSIFESSKLAILEGAFEVEPAKLAKVLLPIAEEKGVQVLLSEHGKPLKALAFLLEKPILSQKFEELSGVDWTAFIQSEAVRLGVALTPSATQFLGTIYQGNSWGLAMDLEKLSALGVLIDKKDLDKYDLEAAPNYWALLNGLKSSDVKNRLYALEKLFSINDPAAKIFNIVAAQAGDRIQHVAEYDLAIKSGKLDYEEALVDFVLG